MEAMINIAHIDDLEETTTVPSFSTKAIETAPNEVAPSFLFSRPHDQYNTFDEAIGSTRQRLKLIPIT